MRTRTCRGVGHILAWLRNRLAPCRRWGRADRLRKSRRKVWPSPRVRTPASRG